ncbi:MAG TPA: 50S ribosomal protein L24 [Candidatus Paceibacterota bacterium]|nr:50S ribosomal protein L24 [Candidatus Paceibacterota bacterium]
MKIKKGDNVMMLSGKDRGKTGKILAASPEDNKVVVQGLNTVKRHVRARKQGQRGQIIERERWVNASAVGFVGADGRPTRLGYRVAEDGSKVRVDRKTGNPV